MLASYMLRLRQIWNFTDKLRLICLGRRGFSGYLLRRPGLLPVRAFIRRKKC